jgi:broad specificity phosphatase PhoE
MLVNDMAYLILVRHSLPQMNSLVPANQWRLSYEGRARCQFVVNHLVHYPLIQIISSIEVKAQETAQIVAKCLHMPYQVYPGLHEHERPDATPSNPDEFIATIERFFAQPEKLVFGQETADQVCTRFSQAIHSLLEQYPDKNLVIITHGTVISLFLSRFCGVEPFSFWKRLGLPDFVVISMPGYLIHETRN